MTTAGAQIHRRVRAVRLRRAREGAGLLLAIALLLGVVIACFDFAVGPHLSEWGRGATTAAIALSGIWATASMIRSGTEHLSWGGQAEGWTAEALRKAMRWARVFNDIRFERYNVDHVVVGSHGVAAVETKWRGRGLYDEPSDASEDMLASAREAARKIRLLLSTEKLRHDPLPVLFLWGPGALRQPPTLRQGVLVVQGHDGRRELREALRPIIGTGPCDERLAAPIASHLKRCKGR